MNTALVKSFFTYGLGNILFALVNIMLIPIYLEKMSVNDYAIFSVFLISIQVIMTIGTFGFSNGILRYITDHTEEYDRKVILSTCLLFLLAISFLFFVVFYLFKHQFAKAIFDNSSLSILILPLVITSMTRVFTTVINGFQRARNQAKAYVALNIISILSLSILGIYIVFQKDYTLEKLVYGYSLSGLITVLAGILFIKESLVLNYSIPILKALLKYGLPLSLASMFTFLINYGNRYYLVQFASIESIAILDVAQRIAGLLGTIFTGAFLTAFTPYYLNLYLNTQKEHFYSQINKVTILFSTIYFLIALCISLCSSIGLTFFSKAEYIQCNNFIPFIIINNYLNVIYMILAMGTNINKETKIEFYITVGLFLSSIPLNIILIKTFDIFGALTVQFILNILSIWLIIIYNKYKFMLKLELLKIVSLVVTYYLFNITYTNIVGKLTTVSDYIFSVLIIVVIIYLYVLLNIRSLKESSQHFITLIKNHT